MKTPMAKLNTELASLCSRIGRPIQVMEVCGTHTVSAFRCGLRSMLPDNLKLVSGPGCPVCVTAQRHIDAAIELGSRSDLVVATYGDMMRVPGRLGNLELLRAHGARVQIVTSALAALEFARTQPDTQVVFLGVGFETTAPATAATILQAEKEQIDNFSVLLCHKLVVPAMMALLEDDTNSLDGFLCPGHVSVVIGAEAYRPVVELCRKPCVVTGFEPEQMMTGLVHLMQQVVSRRAMLENVYPAVVSDSGNDKAQELMNTVFIPEDTAWRALGTIPLSGLGLIDRFAHFDAARRFNITIGEDHDNPACRCGEVIQGKVEPVDCELFDNGCTPLRPVGPCMVSSEGTCAAWYKYNRVATTARST